MSTNESHACSRILPIADSYAELGSLEVNDAALRKLLSTRFQAPYLEMLMEYLGESEQRILLFIYASQRGRVSTSWCRSGALGCWCWSGRP